MSLNCLKKWADTVGTLRINSIDFFNRILYN